MSSLAETFKRLPNAPYLFIGSGFSRRYCDNAPNWRELLIQFAKITRPGKQFPLRSYEDELEEDLTANQRYARVAGKIEKDYNRMFYNGEIPVADEHAGIDYEKYPERSPFRTHLAYLMKCTAKRANLSPELQEELSDLRVAAKHCINGVITTNYDDFTENLFSEFEVYRGQDDLIVTHATGYAEIYKIHGDYRNPEEMVFTEKDYEGFEQRKAYLVSKLLSIFVENPLIILGYSLSDDNIRGILESIAGCLSAKRLKELGERIIYVAYDEESTTPFVTMGPPLDKYRDFYITMIKTNSFAPIFKQMIKLHRRYPLHLLRRIRQDLYRTVVSNEPQDIIRVLPQHVIMDEDSGNIVSIVGFSNEDDGAYGDLTLEEAYNLVVFQNKDIHFKSFVKKLLPKKLEQGSYPVFYFIRKYLEQGGDGTELSMDLLSYIKKINGVDSFLNPTMRTKWKPGRTISTILQLEQNWDNEKNKINKLAVLDEEELNNGQLLNVLRRIMQESPNMLGEKTTAASNLRRLIRICDYVENAKAILLSEDGKKLTLRAGAMRQAERVCPEEQAIPVQAPSVPEN